MGGDSGSLHLLSLPYDIRYLIYQHLFPTETQIYIQVDLHSSLYKSRISAQFAFGTAPLRPSWQLNEEADLHSSVLKRLALAEQHEFPTGLLRVSRQLNEEAGAYLYSMYVFNIIGAKHDCLVVYEDFLNTMRRYARPGCEPCATAFSNGTHSNTMCMSLHSGAGATAMVQRRQRGKRIRIEYVREEIEREVQREARRGVNWYDRSTQRLQTYFLRSRSGLPITVWILSVLAISIAWVAARRAAAE
jgi:hypothetical protein